MTEPTRLVANDQFIVTTELVEEAPEPDGEPQPACSATCAATVSSTTARLSVGTQTEACIAVLEHDIPGGAWETLASTSSQVNYLSDLARRSTRGSVSLVVGLLKQLNGAERLRH